MPEVETEVKPNYYPKRKIKETKLNENHLRDISDKLSNTISKLEKKRPINKLNPKQRK